MNRLLLTVTAFTAFMALLVFSNPAHAELHSRLGGVAAYDDVLDVTWLTDAALSGSSSWDDQVAWVEGLNDDNYLGFSDWRIASMSVAAGLPTGLAESVNDCSTIWAPLCQDNELGYMFFYNLGGSTSQDLTGDHTVGDVTLTNVQPIYWSGTESGPSASWMYHFDIGFGVWSFKNGNRFAWVVRDGDVLPPGNNCSTIGAADTLAWYATMLSALFGFALLAGVARRLRSH